MKGLNLSRLQPCVHHIFTCATVNYAFALMRKLREKD